MDRNLMEALYRKALGGRGASAAVAKAMIQELNLPVCD